LKQDLETLHGHTKWGETPEHLISGAAVKEVFDGDQALCKTAGARNVQGWESVSTLQVMPQSG